MSVAGVNGEGSPGGGTGTIEISSFSWGVDNSGTATTKGAGGSSGKTIVRSVVVTKQTDAASPVLFKYACAGHHYSTVSIEVRSSQSSGAAPGDSMTIVLSNVFVSSYSISGGGDENPEESVTLNFTKMR